LIQPICLSRERLAIGAGEAWRQLSYKLWYLCFTRLQGLELRQAEMRPVGSDIRTLRLADESVLADEKGLALQISTPIRNLDRILLAGAASGYVQFLWYDMTVTNGTLIRPVMQIRRALERCPVCFNSSWFCIHRVSFYACG